MHRMLDIGIVGYGRMGRMVEEIALAREHNIRFKTSDSKADWAPVDVLIEFSRPEAALGNIRRAMDMGIPMVTGTTGWHNEEEEVRRLVEEKNGRLLYASNFSIGVNMLFMLNENLSKLMSQQGGYRVALEEIHHTQKKDSPSGTAISIAQGIIEHNERYDRWQEGTTVDDHIIPVNAIREPDVPGTHIIRWENDIDRIELFHAAKNRKGFAEGAVKAAEWLVDHQGMHSMRDLMTDLIKKTL